MTSTGAAPAGVSGVMAVAGKIGNPTVQKKVQTRKRHSRLGVVRTVFVTGLPVWPGFAAAKPVVFADAGVLISGTTVSTGRGTWDSRRTAVAWHPDAHVIVFLTDPLRPTGSGRRSARVFRGV